MPTETGFLKSKQSRILTGVLLAQAALFYGLSRGETTAIAQPLDLLPEKLGSWQMIEKGVVEKEVADVLRADDLLTRAYSSNVYGLPVHLFIAYFKTQRTGQSPHSPKNCLPGSGWTWTVSDHIDIPIDGRNPIEVNRYIIQRGDAKSVVLYWYQSRDRVVASEYSAKVYTVADAVRYNRTDTAMIRVVVPVYNNDEKHALDAAVKFVQDSFKPIRHQFPA